MPIFKLTTISLLTALIGLLLIPPVQAQDDRRLITVQGIGRVAASPDMAVIRAGVVTQAVTPAAAIAENNQAVAKLHATVKRFGIAEKDLRTTNFSLAPQYRRDRHTPPEIVAYRVSNNVTVRVRMLENLGALLDQLAADGTNQLGGITFTIKNPQDLEDKARANAIGDAKRRAALYAKELDVTVGRAVKVTENGASRPGPVMFRAAEARAASAVPIAPGEQEISAQVTVVFEIR